MDLLASDNKLALTPAVGRLVHGCNRVCSPESHHADSEDPKRLEDLSVRLVVDKQAHHVIPFIQHKDTGGRVQHSQTNDCRVQ